jgi:anti-sigma regulatory factor (Ser/Thr protein kinase)
MSIDTQKLEITFDTDLTAPEQARRSLEVVGENLGTEMLDDVRLLVNELVTNSVKFAGRGSIAMKLVAHDDQVRVEVHDQGPGFAPSSSPPLLTDTSGRGLFLVNALSDRWGVTLDGTTCVWFEIDVAAGAA